MKNYRLYQIDSFTNTVFSGNPAGVITNADGLRTGEMKLIARELNNSETAFIFSDNSSDYDVHVRFFTPTAEVPVCGHATIAAHYAYALENNFESCEIIQKTGAGNLPVRIMKDKDDYVIRMTQGSIEFGNIIDGDIRLRILRALGLSIEDTLDEAPVQIVSTGHSKVMIGIKNIDILHELKPDMTALSFLSTVIGCNGYYVFTLDEDNRGALVHGRMFAPAIGINEDPVTGNANGPLGAYLVEYGLVDVNRPTLKYTAVQGERMNRTGYIDVEVEIDNKRPVKVHISGGAKVVFSTILHV